MNALKAFDHWTYVREDLLQALEMLDDEQLGFVPREGLWSLGKVVLHIAEAEEGWFRYSVRGEIEAWPSYEPADYPTVASVRALLDEVHGRTREWLSTLDADQLDEVVELPGGARTTLRWCIFHVLEHEIHHRGEIFLMLGLMGMEAPDI